MLTTLFKKKLGHIKVILVIFLGSIFIYLHSEHVSAQNLSVSQCFDYASSGDLSIIDVDREEYCAHKFTSVGTTQFETYENQAG